MISNFFGTWANLFSLAQALQQTVQRTALPFHAAIFRVARWGGAGITPNLLATQDVLSRCTKLR
jgi:hypothetical protein